jgi:hypothetical protein
MAKAIKKQALGRGLSALLKDPDNDIKSIGDKNADKVVGSIIELDINFIEIKKNYDFIIMRKFFLKLLCLLIRYKIENLKIISKKIYILINNF